MQALSVVMLVLVLLLGMMKATDMAMAANEQTANPVSGVMADVGDHRMHVYTVDQGGTSIVLLPGLGAPTPVPGFEPLMREPSQWARVVVMGSSGYG